jgi:hypothetical protein
LSKFTLEEFEIPPFGLITVFGMNNQTIFVGLDQDFSKLSSREVIIEEVEDLSLGKELTSEKDTWGHVVAMIWRQKTWAGRVRDKSSSHRR